MHVMVQQPDLARALALVTPVADGGHLPQLEHVHLRAEGDVLTLTATDLAVAVGITVAAVVRVAGALTVPASRLAVLVDGLAAGPVALEADADGRALAVRAGRSRASFVAGDPDAFPEPPPLPGEPRVALLGAELRPALGQVLAVARAADDARPALAAVRWEFDPPALVAVDGVRLALRRLPVEAAAPLPAVTVPRRAVAALHRLLGHAPGPLTVAPDRARGLLVAETAAGARWAARLVEAAYPDYRAVLPAEPPPVRAVLDRAELRSALRRSAGFDAVDHTVALVATPAGDGPGRLTVAARGRETGDAVSELEAEVVGGPLTVHLNAGLLDGLLRAFGDARVELGLHSPTRACVIRPAGATDLTYLLMPCLPEPGLEAAPADAAPASELASRQEVADAMDGCVRTAPARRAAGSPRIDGAR